MAVSSSRAASFVPFAVLVLGCGGSNWNPGLSGQATGNDGGVASTPPGMDGAPTEAGAQQAFGKSPAGGLHVEGNHLVDGGKIVRLLGVNISGTENYCEQGAGIFQAPHDASLLPPMKAWHINTVRVPLNESCWLGINGVKAEYGGAAYQQAIVDFVQLLRSNGIYVVLDLHLNAPGATLAVSQQPMADADHSITFWQSVAERFKGESGVVFDLYNEPNVDGGNVTVKSWDCWLAGCSVDGWQGVAGAARTAGMQQMLDAVRAAGATNVVLVNGLGSGEFLGSDWLAHQPSDRLHNLVAGHHNYSFNNGCNSKACWDSTVAQVAAKVPVVVGELGENDCGHGYVDTYFAWADSLGISYLGWTWNTWDCGSGPALITDFNGTPTGFGQGFKDHLPTQ
jgi:endoglucanase